MLSNYVKLALRNLAKYRLYAFINIAGLALGLTVFLFSSVFVAYETGYDRVFPKHDRIFAVYSRLDSRTASAADPRNSIRLAYGPLLEARIGEAGHVARTVLFSVLITTDNDRSYQSVRFVDPDFTRMFNFEYIHGDQTALDDGRGTIITASKARELFGRVDVVGEPVILEKEYQMHVAAVIEDLPEETHFESVSSRSRGLTFIAPFKALVSQFNFIKMNGDWTWSSSGNDLTYILLPEERDQVWLQKQVDAVYNRHTPMDERQRVTGLQIRPLTDVNEATWDDSALPILKSIRTLGVLVLIIACINYTNLATAQSFNRTREVGLRKTFGAGRAQLFRQFTIESLAVTVCAMLVAAAATELVVAAYNTWVKKDMALEYIHILPFLILTMIIVGLSAGAYPAYLISRLNPIDNLRGVPVQGEKGVILRGLMIAAQFSASVFILAMVMVIHFQNEKMQSTADVFPASKVVVLQTNGKTPIRRHNGALKRQISALPGVETVAFSNSVPLDQVTWDLTAKPAKSDNPRTVDMKMVSVDYDFMALYGIELLAGRPFGRTSPRDALTDRDGDQLNVIVNRLAAEKLNLLTPDEDAVNALGRSFHRVPDEWFPIARRYTVIGVVENVNFNGLYHSLSPMVFFINPFIHYFMSIKLNGDNPEQTLAAIDTVSKRVITDYPVQRRWLKDRFNSILNYFRDVNRVLAICAGVALSLALIGLFGLTAFMARRRTREIGIRKVMGAGRLQIVRLLIWQFSLPVILALLVAVPAAWLASEIYLDYFAQPISHAILIILAAGLTCLLFAWTIIAAHAFSVARTRPADSLRYE